MSIDTPQSDTTTANTATSHKGRMRLGWDVETLAWGSKFALVIGSILLAIIAALGLRWEDQADERTEIREEEYKRTAAKEIEIAKADASRANAEASRANESAARLGKETEELRLQVSEQQERAAKAEVELERFKRDVAPRKLTPSQRESLINAFGARKGTLIIVSPIMNPEANDFADQIDEAFRAVNWDTLRIRNWIHTGYGVSVGYPSGTSDADVAGMGNLAKLLTSILGLPVGLAALKDGDASMSPQVQKGFAYLLIAQKPAPKPQ
jgi:hypothetical protein